VVVITAAGRTELRQVPLAEPAAGQVTVALAGCGVCGSNLPVWEGRPWFSYPLPPGEPGHEGWGEVVAAGEGVSDVTPGDHVAVLANGAFASAVTVDVGDVVALPEALRGRPFPGEAFGSAFNVAARAGFGPGQRVAVVGIGFIGAVVTALAAAAGAEVVAMSRRPFSLDVARTMGATEVRKLDDAGGGPFDVVVEAVGSQAALDLASALPGVRGRLVIAGFHQDGARTIDLQSWNWRGIDVINAHERDPEVIRAGVRRAAAAVAGGELDVAPLLTHDFPLARAGDALDAMRDRPDGFLKAVVRT
jgi:2-desacetyl-2-hydroxyethyl bacteriochlorophyllide A dehydrogenase